MTSSVSSSSRSADGLIVPMRPGAIDRHHAGRDPLEDRLDVAAPALAFVVLPLEIDAGALEPPAARRHFGRHRVERFDHRAELVGALVLDAVVVVAGADLRAASDSICTGRVMRFARYRPIHVEPTRISSVTITKNDT